MRSFFAVAASVTSTGATTYTAGDSTHHAPNCYGFPNKPFTPTNYVNICDPSGCLDEGLGVKSGDIAPNFALSSVDGNNIDLYTVLDTSKIPVFIQFGSFTWPIYQFGISDTNKLADYWREQLNYLLVYTIDAHPQKPDPSPYAGKPWTMPFSQLRQPRIYKDRVKNAKDVNKGLSTLHGNFTVLVDDLSPHNNTNNGSDSTWCVWGPAPNAGFFILVNRTVALAQTWFSLKEMNETMMKYLEIKE